LDLFALSIHTCLGVEMGLGAQILTWACPYKTKVFKYDAYVGDIAKIDHLANGKFTTTLSAPRVELQTTLHNQMQTRVDNCIVDLEKKTFDNCIVDLEKKTLDNCIVDLEKKTLDTQMDNSHDNTPSEATTNMNAKKLKSHDSL